jgi:hypothetical protein
MPQRQVSHIRKRDIALGMLIPKLLGILWEIGAPDKFGAKAIFAQNIEICSYRFRKNAVDLSVWSPMQRCFQRI